MKNKVLVYNLKTYFGVNTILVATKNKNIKETFQYEGEIFNYDTTLENVSYNETLETDLVIFQSGF